ncbi:hypothetical protein VNO78_33320 [Psophocarpus tetragonolobus]|uniref:Transmembrane protein n=1 Tax=Psophocarpus tetragonolobus TaxID=3891 RepID=A0AAN9NX29_PSOTE
MEKKALKILVILLFLSYVVHVAAVPATRISMANKVDPIVLEDQTKSNIILMIFFNLQDNLFAMKEGLAEGRMIMDITDYPPTGPNHSHTPKSPGKP